MKTKTQKEVINYPNLSSNSHHQLFIFHNQDTISGWHKEGSGKIDIDNFDQVQKEQMIPSMYMYTIPKKIIAQRITSKKCIGSSLRNVHIKTSSGQIQRQMVGTPILKKIKRSNKNKRILLPGLKASNGENNQIQMLQSEKSFQVDQIQQAIITRPLKPKEFINFDLSIKQKLFQKKFQKKYKKLPKNMMNKNLFHTLSVENPQESNLKSSSLIYPSLDSTDKIYFTNLHPSMSPNLNAQSRHETKNKLLPNKSEEKQKINKLRKIMKKNTELTEQKLKKNLELGRMFQIIKAGDSSKVKDLITRIRYKSKHQES